MKAVQVILVGLVLGIGLAAVVAHATEVKLTADDAAAGDIFGVSVSISGDYAIVGAYFDDDNGSDSGAAYIFVRDGSSWNQQQKLTDASCGLNDTFGWSVSISGDYAIVGSAPWPEGGGKVFMFARNGETWTKQSEFTKSDGYFSSCVSISGGYAIAGAFGVNSHTGTAYIFVRSGENWTQQAQLAPDDAAAGDRFGCSVSISDDYATVGAINNDDGGSDSGSAYIFKRDGSSWNQQAKLTADDAAAVDRFGRSVSISGDYAIVGAGDDDFDSKTDAGSAYIFKCDGSSWNQQQKLTASDAAADDAFGYSVSISGDYVMVGAAENDDNGTGSGSAYSFLRSGSSWTQKAKITASDAAAGDYFGRVSISGNYAIVGAHGDDHAGGTDAGSAYIYHSIDDLSLPVELSLFTAQAEDGEVVLRWVTESETDNLGFHVYRAFMEDGEYERLTAELIEGAGTASSSREYAFMDIRLTNGVTYWYKIEDVAFDGTRTLHGPISVTPQAEVAMEAKALPSEFGLSQNVPNPFNPATEIRYQLPEASHVMLAVYDALGRKVQVLVEGFMDAGYRSVVWDAKAVASGTYFVRMEAGDFVEVRKMALIR